MKIQTKKKQTLRCLTSDVLHGDGAGGGQFSRNPEGFVAQLLINERTFRKRRDTLSPPEKTLDILTGTL